MEVGDDLVASKPTAVETPLCGHCALQVDKFQIDEALQAQQIDPEKASAAMPAVDIIVV